MPPSSDTPERLKSLVDLCKRISKCLPTSIDIPAVEALLSEISTASRLIEKLCHKRLAPFPKQLNALDRAASNLWNTDMRFLRQAPEAPGKKKSTPAGPPRKLLVKVMVFAFASLDLARLQGSENGAKGVLVDTRLEVFRLSLSASRICLEGNDFNECLSILKRSVEISETLEKKNMTDEDTTLLKKYNAEYFILRTCLAYKQNRLDVANHMYDQGVDLLKTLDPQYSENLAEVVFEIGKLLMHKNDYKLSVVWLKRAYDIITLHDIGKLSRLGIEQRLAIIQALIQGHLRQGTPEGRALAEELVCCLEAEIGDDPAVLLLRIQVLRAAPAEEFDIAGFADLLARFSRVPHLTEAQFKTILNQVKTLKERNPLKALAITTKLTVGTAVPSGNSDWVSKALIILVWIHATSENIQTDISLLDTVDEVHAMLKTPVDAQTAGAVQAILWKRIESAIAQSRLQEAEQWCRVALHPLFENCGVLNQGKIWRKLIICALERQDLDKAKEIFHNLPVSVQKEQFTAFLMFKVATRSHDKDLAAACLQSVSQNSAAGRDILYACVLDSQNTGNLDTAILAMKSLMEVTEALPESDMHVPSLMRCIVRLLYQKMKKGSDDTMNDIATDICVVFETAVRAIARNPKDKHGGKLFDIRELDWFSQNSYNTALKSIKTWSPDLGARLMMTCIQFIDCYPPDISLVATHDLALKKLCGAFVIGASLVAVARAEENIKEKLQAYLQLRKYVALYDEEFELRRDTFEPDIRTDLVGKLAVLYVFDFEAAAAQREWDDVRAVVVKAALCQNEVILKGMGDYLLSLADVPVRELHRILKLIINEIWKLEHFDQHKLAKYMRCLFQAVLPHGDDLALEVLDNVLGVAKDSAEQETKFPPEELEWVSVMAFNHGTDLWSTGNDDEARKWFDKALSLACYLGDDGVFESQIQDRLTKLQWK